MTAAEGEVDLGAAGGGRPAGGEARANGPGWRPGVPPPEGRTGELLELDPDLRCQVASNPGPLTLDGTRTYLVGARRAAVVDPGPDAAGRPDLLLEALGGTEVEAVCLTHAHADHAGCAAAAAAALGAPLAASPEALRRLGLEARPLEGRPLEDGDELPVDGGASRLRALATPGHSGDHLSFLWLPSRRLFTGDLVLGWGSSLVAHPDGSVGAYLASLARLVALRPSRILPGHGPPVEDAVARLEAYRRHRLEREGEVLEAARRGAADIAELRARVYGDLPDALRRAAELSVLAHLRHLRETGHPLPEPLARALEVAADARGPEEGTGAAAEP